MSYFKDDLSERVNRYNRESMGLDNSADRSIFNKRLFDYTSGPRTRSVFLPDPVVVGTPFEALPYFIDAGRTIKNLVTPAKKQNGGEDQLYVPIDPNSYPSTNPTITVAPNRLSDREYYEEYLKLLTGEEFDNEERYKLNLIADPQTREDSLIQALTKMADFPEYNYDAANEFYRQDSTAAELGGLPGVYDEERTGIGILDYILRFPRAFNDEQLENIRKFIELTGEGKPRYIAPDYQRGGSLGAPVFDETGITLPAEITGESSNMMIPSAFPANQTISDPGMPSFEMFGITPPTTLDTLPVVTIEDVEADFEANIGPLMTDSDMDGTIDFYQQEEEIEEGDPRRPFAKLSDAAVNVARGMNKMALRRQARQAERDKRIATSADNLFMVSDPIGARGMFDVQTGLAQPDNLVPYLPMGQMGMELEADEETIRELIAAGAQIKFN